jgi:hypothetical protein
MKKIFLSIKKKLLRKKGGIVMKKIIVVILVLSLSISLLGFTMNNNEMAANPKKQTQKESLKIVKPESEIKVLVESFGSKLKLVPLLAPQRMIKNSIQDNYSNYVDKQLLSKWISDPQKAPGRMTSSPWPDRIEVISIKMIFKNEYEVKGQIIELTSVEKANNGIFARRSITLTVAKVNNKWLINKTVLGAYEANLAVSYINTKYGFKFTLPENWRGYKILSSKWEAISVDNSSEEKAAITGPMISIRHPEWTTKVPRQDIPIMIISIKQWNLLMQDKYHIGAAPIGPYEINRNTRYVFALPARYNFAYLKGYEEVEKIIKSNPINLILNK